jgi:hypothetical protein
MKFDVVLSGCGTCNENNRFVFREHIQKHISLMDEGGFYGVKTVNRAFNTAPKLEHKITIPIHEKLSIFIWQK